MFWGIVFTFYDDRFLSKKREQILSIIHEGTGFSWLEKARQFWYIFLPSHPKEIPN
jgi:hypothetical protein